MHRVRSQSLSYLAIVVLLDQTVSLGDRLLGTLLILDDHERLVVIAPLYLRIRTR